MSVGQTISNSAIDTQLTALSIALRNVMQQANNLNTFVNGQNNGLAFLESIGYDATDAQTAMTLIGYLTTLAGVYYGTATQATDFDFNNALAQLWGGNV